jgi:hypothetical protein
MAGLQGDGARFGWLEERVEALEHRVDDLLADRTASAAVAISVMEAGLQFFRSRMDPDDVTVDGEGPVLRASGEGLP